MQLIVMMFAIINPLVTIDAYKRHTGLWWFMCVLAWTLIRTKFLLELETTINPLVNSQSLITYMHGLNYNL